MSKEFIEQKIGLSSITKARRQQSQLSYFTQSVIQEDITNEYVNQWANRKYSGDDLFLNWVKAIFKQDNFMSFFKYFRAPIASSNLVNNTIKPQLQRVFFSEDSYFKYSISGEQVETPEELNVKDFDNWMFNSLLFKHNDILITDLRDVNTPFRDLISIENVVAIESKRNIIHRLAYTASVIVVDDDGIQSIRNGFLFMDDKEYIFYDEDINPIVIVPHDLGECPADYISNEAFSDDDIIRKSIFSHVREGLEEYVFLKTLLKMTEPNGAIPIVTKLETKQNKGGKDIEGSTDKQPMSSGMGSQRAERGKEIQSGGGFLETGTVHEIPQIRDFQGKVDMEAVKNFLNFFFIPIESLNYINGRITEIKESILSDVLGDIKNQSGERKNEKQVQTGLISAEDSLRSFSMQLSRIRERSDFKFLALAHGRDRVHNEAFYGSDFFLESQEELFDLFEKSPNTIERKNLLLKLAKNRNRFNPDRSKREVILYHLLPYVSDQDFDAAINKQAVGDVTFQYQTRFNYWIGMFESRFGDILSFWETIDAENSEKIILINNLIVEIVTTETEKVVIPPEN